MADAAGARCHGLLVAAVGAAEAEGEAVDLVVSAAVVLVAAAREEAGRITPCGSILERFE